MPRVMSLGRLMSAPRFPVTFLPMDLFTYCAATNNQMRIGESRDSIRRRTCHTSKTLLSSRLLVAHLPLMGSCFGPITARQTRSCHLLFRFKLSCFRQQRNVPKALGDFQ